MTTLSNDLICEICLYLEIVELNEFSMCSKSLWSIIHGCDWLWNQVFNTNFELAYIEKYDFMFNGLTTWRERCESCTHKFQKISPFDSPLPSPPRSISPSKMINPLVERDVVHQHRFMETLGESFTSNGEITRPRSISDTQLLSNAPLYTLYHQLLEHHHGGKAVCNLNDHGTKWITAPCSKIFTPGYLYQWSVLVDNIEVCNNNYWKIIVGVIPLSAKPITEKGRMRRKATGVWISSEGVEGIGLILASNRIIYQGNDFFKLGDGYRISNGDVVTMRFDMSHSSEENDEILRDESNHVACSKEYQQQRRELLGRSDVGASIQFLVNGVPIMQEPFYFIDGQSFYPAVSLINKQKVTVLNCTQTKLERGENEVIADQSSEKTSAPCFSDEVCIFM